MGRGERLVTVVFADVAGSTGLVDRLGDDAGTLAVARQLGVLRDRLADHGGHEVKALGDGLLLTFDSPRQAIGFAVAAQRALARSAPQVRIGINAGTVLDADDDPVGAAVNAAARIAARAEGGEILLSDVVRQLAGTTPSVHFVDRGRAHLRGFAETWQLWAVVDGAVAPDLSPTIGRDEELRALSALVDAVGTGSGQAVVVEGEAGIGKSHLLAVLAHQASSAGLTVVQARMDEVARRAGELARTLAKDERIAARRRSRLRSLLEDGEGADDRSHAVMEGAADALEVLTRAGPVLLVVDDLHWADDLSLAVAREVVRRTPSCALGVVAAFRPSPRPALVDRLVEAVLGTGGRALRLGPLGELDVQALAASLTGAAPAPRLRARLRATGGNPLFVAELLRTLDDEQQLRIEAGVAEIPEDARTPGLTSLVQRRLRWLPAETVDLLRLASLLGTTFSLTELGAVTNRPVVEIAAWMREATVAGLVSGDGDRLRFRHDVVREAIYDGLVPAERRDLHRAVGQALARANAPAQQVAWQFARGAEVGDDEAVAWLVRAADEVMWVAPDAAVDLFEQALALASPTWARRAEVQASLLEPLARCGRFDRGEALAAAVLATAPAPAVAFEVERGLAALHGNRGDIPLAIECIGRAVAQPGAPARESARLSCFSAQLETLLGLTSAEEAMARASDELRRASELGDPTGQCVAWQVLGAVSSIRGDSGRARRELERAMALYESGHVVHASYLIPDLFHAGALLYLDEIDECLLATDRARRRHLDRGALTQLPLSHMIAAAAHLSVGGLADAEAEIDAGMAVADETGSRNFVLYFRALRARIAVARGLHQVADQELGLGTAELAGGSLFGADWLLDSRAELLAASGDTTGALALAELVWTGVPHLRLFYGHRERGEQLARLALAAGRADLAEEAATCMAVAAERNPVPGARAAALHVRSLVDEDRAGLGAAIEALRATPYRPHLARVGEDLAGLLLRSGGVQEAVPLLEEAAAFWASIGADGHLGRLQRILAALGRTSRRSQPRPTFGWDALTPMERTVVDLVAEGLTNPEIADRLHISRRTVESHVAHVFRKVGCSTRSQLAAEVVRRS